MTRLRCGCIVRKAGGIRLCPMAAKLEEARQAAEAIGNVILYEQVLRNAQAHWEQNGLRGAALIKALKLVHDDGRRRGAL